MVQHVNFYENLKEAEMRLLNTIVLYEGVPYYVLCICDHKADGIYRVYLDPIGDMAMNKIGGIPFDHVKEYDSQHRTRGQMMDDWMDANPNSGILRKMANSPHFNKFRPFELGMTNYGGATIYLERRPVRNTQQGLTQTMLSGRRIDLSGNSAGRGTGVDFTGPSMRDCILGNFPSAEECVKHLNNPRCDNEAAAFHRRFALVRGPVGTLFLAFKSDIVGILPDGDLSVVRLSTEFKHVKEQVEELGLFKVVK